MSQPNKSDRDVEVQISESGANTPTDRVSRTILDVANDIRSDGTRTFAQEITRLISESRDARDQSERMGEILHVMKRLLSCMRDMTAKQKNIAMPVKDGVIVLIAAAEAMDEVRSSTIQPHKTARKQTNEEAPVISDRAAGIATPGRKRRLRDSPMQNSPSKRGKTDQNVFTIVTRRKKTTRPDMANIMGPQQQQQVKNEKKVNPRPRRCAIHITSTGKKSYADILKDLTSKVKPEDAKAVVRNTRQTNNGGVLLELEKRSEDKVAFQRVIQENLGSEYQVKGLTPRLTLEIGGMTCVTTEEQVKAAIREEVSDAGDLTTHVFDVSGGERRMAIVEMEETAAVTLLRKGRIKIGYFSYRVRKRIVVPRCFRCQGFGHLKKDCKDEDRSALCRKCGKPDHTARDCHARPDGQDCFLCKKRGVAATELAHFPGTGSCVAFRDELGKLKRAKK